jgi:hypothetical protein
MKYIKLFENFNNEILPNVLLSQIANYVINDKTKINNDLIPNHYFEKNKKIVGKQNFI